ncbi:sensor histidine kinase [Paludibacterium purpuratum]|uniref:histidine kinase n=1 Tax=Paludibacterium purpuratum TaxID=1144873 RepID=A0A4R7BCE9_9NEIS|nr:ATP-binding protein [Paludibacterium purpuratum]TDR81595.1 histidine kinase/DNA gyrase B/HSP90-like ATPase [Paludibacterium purpuratum]
MMKSIKAQLTVWLIVGITVILSVMGYVSFSTSKAQGEADYQALRTALQERLALSLPHGVWQLDDQYIQLTLDAELGWQSLIAIRIKGDAGLNIGRIRDSRGLRDMTPTEEPAADDILTIPIVYQGKEKLGVAEVFLSRSDLNAQLRSHLMESLMQIVLLDVLILFMMSYALRHFVFHPLKELQDALDLAASSSDLESATFSVNQKNEFGDVMHSFNRIVARIMDDLKMRTQAEANAREEKEKAQDAYRRLVQTQQTLVESEKLASLGGLVAGVAHEINTPVGISLTAASHLAAVTQQLNSELEAGAIKKSDFQNYLATAKESCELILSNAERAANLIHSFKQVAVDQTSEARRDFQLEDYLHEIITSLRPKFKRTSIEIQIDCEPDLLMDSYPGALSQVMTNLLVNAVTHAFDESQPGRIEIAAHRLENGYLSLTVKDNGKGIAPENMGKIFQPFFTTRRGSGGSGLGLHIVYNVVRQRLGGSIDVSSALGEGTVFSIRLPCIAPSIAPKEGS